LYTQEKVHVKLGKQTPPEGSIVRVIGGSARGRTLKGSPDLLTRATADQVREALFNIVAVSIAGARVLDLYAGTGALGIEALSRSADTCDFVERRRALCQVIEENLRRTELGSAGHIYCGSVHQMLSTLVGPYDLILADPPYADPEGPALIALPALHRLLAPLAIVVLEHSPRVTVPTIAGPLRYLRTRRYGDSALSFWRCGDDEEEGLG
jgi:16S rRNA (guanine966-N2)-methyltransferase